MYTFLLFLSDTVDCVRNRIHLGTLNNVNDMSSTYLV